MEITAETIGEGLEAIITELDKAPECSSQKGQTQEFLCTKLTVKNPLEGDQYPFWTKRQTQWYLHNFVATPAWMQTSRELAEKEGLKGSSYCYNLRYLANDGGTSEINSVLNALQDLEKTPKTFKEVYTALDKKSIVPDITFSALKYLKTNCPDVWKTIKSAMKSQASLDFALPVAGFAYQDGSHIVPKQMNNFEEQVVQELKLDKNSRRAYTSGKYELTDVAGRVGRPPFSSYQALVRNGKVQGIIYMRSNDMLWGAQLDIHHGILFAQKICDALDGKYEIGPINLISASAHAYKNIPVLESRGLHTVEDIRKSGTDGIQKWLLHVTATKSADYYEKMQLHFSIPKTR